jgi:hypothetical protein
VTTSTNGTATPARLPGAPPAEPVRIFANSVYTQEQARHALGLERHTLAREIRLGRLKASRRGKRYYILGAWLLSWIKAGTITKRRPKGKADKAES